MRSSWERKPRGPPRDPCTPTNAVRGDQSSSTWDQRERETVRRVCVFVVVQAALKYHTLGASTPDTASHSSGRWVSRSRCGRVDFLEAPSWVTGSCHRSVPMGSSVGTQSKLSDVPSYKDANRTRLAPHLRPPIAVITSLEAPSPNTLGVGDSR